MYFIFLLLFFGSACITAGEPQIMNLDQLADFMEQLELQNQIEANEQAELQAKEEEKNPVSFVVGEASAAPVVAAAQASKKPRQPQNRKRKEQADKEIQEDPNKKKETASAAIQPLQDHNKQKPQKIKDRKRKDGEE